MKKKIIGIVFCILFIMSVLPATGEIPLKEYGYVIGYTGGDDTEPPVVVITYPEDGQNFLNPDIVLMGYVSDNVGIIFFSAYNYWNEEEYEIYSEIFLEPQPFYEFQFDVTLKPGKNNLVVSAYDEAENKDGESINVTQTQCTHDTPIITDSSGETTFHGVFVGCDHRGTPGETMGAENSAEVMHDNLRNMPGWDEANMELFLGAEAIWDNIKNSIARAANRAQPGDEFLFYFCDHGGNQTIIDDDGDEPDGFDEHLVAADRPISDDILALLLSNFPDCVTITVKLDCCHSGGFADGENDVQHATNADGDEYGPDHINIEPACGADEVTHTQPYLWEDDGDVMVEPGELTEVEQYHYEDENGNGRWDRGEEWWWWLDEDGDGEPDEDELHDPGNVTWLGNFTKANLDGLAVDNSFKNSGTTKADRNKDGITTTKELYEYSINSLYQTHYGDNDNDGLIDEDGPDFEETSDGRKKLYIDNDGDGLIDEDPSPSSFAFWYDAKPVKPSKPTGTVNGKAGVEYTYKTITTDPDGDDVYYWFDWGDGTNSEWIGPYTSGDDCDASHSWSEEGSYQVKVKARDRCFAESDWATLEVSMPRNRATQTLSLQFLQSLMQRFPLLAKLLQLPMFEKLII